MAKTHFNKYIGFNSVQMIPGTKLPGVTQKGQAVPIDKTPDTQTQNNPSPIDMSTPYGLGNAGVPKSKQPGNK